MERRTASLQLIGTLLCRDELVFQRICCLTDGMMWWNPAGRRRWPTYLFGKSCLKLLCLSLLLFTIFTIVTNFCYMKSYVRKCSVKWCKNILLAPLISRTNTIHFRHVQERRMMLKRFFSLSKKSEKDGDSGASSGRDGRKRLNQSEMLWFFLQTVSVQMTEPQQRVAQSISHRSNVEERVLSTAVTLLTCDSMTS